MKVWLLRRSRELGGMIVVVVGEVRCCVATYLV